MNKTLAAAAAVASLIGGVTGVAAWSGRAVTQRLSEQTVRLGKVFPGFRIVNEQVEPGLFTTTRTVTVQLGCVPIGLADPPGTTAARAPEPLQLRWRDHVQHGPFPGGEPGLARIDTQLLLPEALQVKLDKQLEGQPPLRADTRVSFSGALSGELKLAGLKLGDPVRGSFTLSPVVAHYSAAPGSGASTKYTFELPRVSARSSAQGETLALQLGALRVEGEVQLDTAPSPWLSPGKGQGKLTFMELKGSGGGASLEARLDAIEFSASSSLENGLWSGSNRTSFRGKIDSFAIDKVEMQTSVKRLHADSYQKLISSLLEVALSCDPSATAQARGLLQSGAQAALMQVPPPPKELFELLAHDPEYALEPLAIELGGKRAELSYRAGTRGVARGDQNTDLGDLLMRKGVLRASAKIQIGLITELAAKFGESLPAGAGAVGLRPGNASQTEALVNGMIDQLAAGGYVTREGDFVRASAGLEAGKLLVNDKPMTLPDFGSLAP